MSTTPTTPTPGIGPGRLHDESGFTLIELLVVILIIAILAAIAIPMFLNQRKAAVNAAVESDVRNAGNQMSGEAVFAAPALPSAFILGMAPSLIAMNQAQGADNPASDFKLSRGTSVEIISNDGHGGFCLVGSNPDSGKYKDGFFATYDSRAGGLNRKSGACPSSLAIGGVDKIPTAAGIPGLAEQHGCQ